MHKTNLFYPPTFEGQAHQRPSQSYAGANARKDRSDLLKHLEYERQKRETARRREAASIKLQSAWRATVLRKKRQQVLAEIFHSKIEALKTNNKPCDIESADNLMRCIVFSGQHNLLEGDIHWFASQILKDVQKFLPVMIPYGQNGQPMLYRFNALLNIVLQRICLSAKATTGMRLLETLLSSKTYVNMKCSDLIVKHSIEFLISHDYYATLLKILISKNDKNLELLPGQQFPVGFSGAILQLMLLPVYSVEEGLVREVVARHFVFDVICRPEKMCGLFVLPAFLHSTVADRLPLLISWCLTENKTQEISPVGAVHVLWFMVNSMKKVDVTSKSSNEDIRKLVECFGLLLKRMPPIDKTESHTPMEVDNSDDESDDEDTRIPYNADAEVYQLEHYAKVLQAEIIDDICSNRAFANILRRVMENSSLEIARFFHELIYRHGVTPSRMRGSFLPVFSKELLRNFYYTIKSIVGPITYPVQVTLMQRIQSGLPLHVTEYDLLIPVLTIFTRFFHWLLLCVNDSEFSDESPDSYILIPFSTIELIDITSNYRKMCAGLVDVISPSRFSMRNDDLVTKPSGYISTFRSACHLLKHLYTRNCRLNFLPEGFWSSVLSTVQPISPPPVGLISYLMEPFSDPEELLSGEFLEGFDPSLTRIFSTNDIHLAIVLTFVPFLLPFEYRYDVFRAVLRKDREANNRSRPMGLDSGMTIDVRVRRQYLYEDAFDRLSLENAPNMKMRLRCQLINFTGLDEAGIDGGGLFREFLSELIQTAFDPNRGLFCLLPKDGRLYPNPSAVNLYSDNWKQHFFFLGRIVGKLLYEKLLVELPLADFFLAKVLSRDFASLDVHYLADLDPVLYKNLLFLKTYAGNVEDLGLDFTLSDDSQISPENPRVYELIPNGKNTVVTGENRIQYTHLVADYKLNRRISGQCRAFMEGLSHVVNIDWLRLFSPFELQMLISGAEKRISMPDWIVNTRYLGEYSESHPTIQVFWSVVKNRLSEEQRRKLLKFVTSCSRPPMFGFKDLEPPFTIHSSGPPDQNGGDSKNGGGGGARLPTASTCINLLKLPEYKDEESMYERLCYSIESQSGFELS